MTTLNTKRMILRKFKSEDSQAVYQYAKNPKIGPIAGWPSHESVEQSRDFITNYFINEHIFAMTLRENPDHAIGLIGLELVNDGNGKVFMKEDEAEISYWLGEPYWGQGLTPEAIEEVVNYGFQQLNLSNIWCGYKDGNRQSKIAQEKQGFKYDRTIPQMYNPYLDEIIIEHFTKLSYEDWLKMLY